MKKIKLVTLALTALIFVGCSKGASESVGAKVPTTEKKQSDAKEYEVKIQEKYLDGKEFKLSDFKGQKVYLKFWASWCSVCMATLGETDELATNKDFKVISMVTPGNYGEKSLDKFTKWFSGLGYKNIPVVVDEDASVFKEFGIRAFPSYLIIDSKGNLAHMGMGHIDSQKVIQIMESIE